jgi:hypothetical protein
MPQRVPVHRPTLQQTLLHLAILGAIGAVVGAISAWVRPYAEYGPHWEAIISLFVVLPAMFIWSAWTVRRTPFRAAIPRLVVAIASICTAYMLAWSWAYGRFWGDMAGVVLAVGAIAAPVLVVLLIGWQRRIATPTFGPYCPACGYWLVGLTEDRCSECGRPFTLAELGIDRAALQPPSAEAKMSP